MELELKSIQERVGLTFIYVTHDQEEALTMSDRLAVMNNGRIEQVGSPADVYEQPVTSFVAGFVGVSNLLSGDAARAITGSKARFTIRPEKIKLTDVNAIPQNGECSATGVVKEVVYVGASTRYTVELESGAPLVVMQQNLDQSSMQALQVKGRSVRLSWSREHNRSIDDAGEGEG